MKLESLGLIDDCQYSALVSVGGAGGFPGNVRLTAALAWLRTTSKDAAV